MNGKKFKDAIFFKIPAIIDNNIIQETQEQIHACFKRNWGNFTIDAKQNIVNWVSGTDNKFTFDLSKAPYDNVLYYFPFPSSIGNKQATVYMWIIKNSEDESAISYSMIPFCIQNNVIEMWVQKDSETKFPSHLHPVNTFYRIDFILNKRDYSVKFDDIIIRDLNGSSVSYNGTTISKKLFYTSFIMKINSLLNCVNIIRVLHKIEGKLQKSRIKRGKLPLHSYYTLQIKGHSIKYENTLSKIDSQWNNRIHLCRGHFKKYTVEKPLFGKFTGLWWWEPAVRGRNKEGVVYKDYELTK